MILRLFATAALVLFALSAPAMAHEHDDVRRGVERGEIRSLVEILGLVKDRLPGDIAGVEVERKHGAWVYEFRVVDPAGRLFEVYVDGKTGAILKTKEK